MGDATLPWVRELAAPLCRTLPEGTILSHGHIGDESSELGAPFCPELEAKDSARAWKGMPCL